ncbi:MAG: glycosyltransferase family 39 protein [Candidatus Scalindua sp.]|nr:glycosyltransferase family 39 protein [Candidatus Scalindua sp.]
MEKNKIGFLHDRYAWIILCCSLMVRIYLSSVTYVIQNDSVAFIENAHFFARGDFQAGLRHDYHPLYSMMMAGVYKIIPYMELSGTIISVFLSTVTVLIFYLIGRGVFNQKISFVSSLILAFHPYAVRFSADIISESTYFFFFLAALGSGFFAIKDGRILLYALTGICSAFAYLARPEGIGIMCIVSGWCLLKGGFRIKVVWKQKLVEILILVASFAVFSIPYLVYIKSETGSWHLTKKKSVSKIAGIEKLIDRQDGERAAEETGGPQTDSGPVHVNQPSDKGASVKAYIGGALYTMEKYISTFHPFLFALFLVGMASWCKIGKKGFFGYYVLSIVLFYLFILLRLNLTHAVCSGEGVNYPSRRHVMPIIIPVLFWVGIGVTAVGTWLYERIQTGKLGVWLLKRMGKSERRVLLVIVVLALGVLLPKTLKPQRFDKVGILQVGKWIRENSEKAVPVVCSTSARNAYYAGGRAVQMADIYTALSLARKENADYIVLTRKEQEVLAAELKQSDMKGQTELVYTAHDSDTSNQSVLFLYKVIY